MSATLHFGPEWMRAKQPPSKSQPASPPPSTPASGASTYSALVSPAPPPQPEKRDETHPFRYSKEEMIRIYKEGGGKGGLGIEVERWEGVVRDVGSEPVALREMGEAEKKLFAGPLNSDLRRRQSTDILSPLATQSPGAERPRLNHNNSSTSSPMRERFGGLVGRRRDSTDSSPLPIPRKLSLSSVQGPQSPRDSNFPSPRNRIGTTPGFDGVLNGGESWVARRRASEGLLKTGGAATSRGEHGGESHDTKGLEITEEEEEDNHKDLRPQNTQDRPSPHQPSPSPQLNSSISAGTSDVSQPSPGQGVEINLANLSISNSNNTGAADLAAGTAAIGPPPGIPDLASVEWSYLDPQGQVQGPFRADLMQKWFDDGYFSLELLMKRTHVDSEWLPVGELARRSGGDKIFLSLPLATPPPPGLGRRTDSPLQGFAPPNDQNPFNAPYQPAPIRTLLTSTLESYLGPGSNPSDSPTSSFGGGRFGNGSPDTSAFGGRGVNNTYHPGDPSVGNRMGGFSAAPEASSPFRRNTFNEHPLDAALGLRSPTFPNMTSGRSASIDNYGFGGGYSPAQAPWQGSSNNAGFDSMPGRGTAESMNFSSGYNHGANNMASAALGQSTSFNGPGSTFPGPEFSGIRDLGNQQDVQLLGRSIGEEKSPAGNANVGFNNFNGGYNVALESPGLNQQYVQSPSANYGIPQPHQPTATLPNVFGNHTSLPKSTPSTQPQIAQNTHAPAPPISPWNTIPDPSIRRQVSYDPSHPKDTSIQNNTTAPISHWGQNIQPVPQGNDPSWPTAAQGATDESWKEIPGPNRLTFSNVGQHNQQQQQLVAPVDNGTNIPEISEQSHRPLPPDTTPSTVTPSVAPGPSGSKPRAKSQLAQSQTPSAKPVSQPQQPPPKAPSPPPVQPSKPAWSTEEESKKSKPSGISLSLREIQDAEAKKFEARKVAERAARAAAPAPAPVGDDIQPFTASWGLPTSQAGSRNVPQKDHPVGTSSTTPAPVTPPVWTTAVKPPTTKKTMKEIQEEEERRKKLAVKDTTTAAARRAYAESTAKSTPPTQGSAWTTVGPSGKGTPPASSTPATRPPVASSSVPGPSSVPRTNGTPVLRAAAPVVAKPATPVAAARIDDHPASPSHEFLRWLSDSLKGLNSSVNVEEIMSMLLSFPLDPDPSTVEIISDLIYANSTTLDGRRFASEFVSKRKADALARPKGSSTTPAVGKPISIADVVKSQPKPTQPEWGGFKVVNKKKKGGRA